TKDVPVRDPSRPDRGPDQRARLLGLGFEKWQEPRGQGRPARRRQRQQGSQEIEEGPHRANVPRRLVEGARQGLPHRSGPTGKGCSQVGGKGHYQGGGGRKKGRGEPSYPSSGGSVGLRPPGARIGPGAVHDRPFGQAKKSLVHWPGRRGPGYMRVAVGIFYQWALICRGWIVDPTHGRQFRESLALARTT